jgi:hypothetical protein
MDEYELQTTPAETSSIEPPPSYHQVDPRHDLEVAWSPPTPPPDADITDMAFPSDNLTSGAGNQQYGTSTEYGTRANPSAAQRARARQRFEREPARNLCEDLAVLFLFVLLCLGVMVIVAYFIALIVYHNKASYQNPGAFYRFVGYLVLVQAATVAAGLALYAVFRCRFRR